MPKLGTKQLAITCKRYWGCLRLAKTSTRPYWVLKVWDDEAEQMATFPVSPTFLHQLAEWIQANVA